MNNLIYFYRNFNEIEELLSQDWKQRDYFDCSNMLEGISFPGESNESSEDQGFSKSPEFDESSYQQESSYYLKEDHEDFQNLDTVFF